MLLLPSEVKAHLSFNRLQKTDVAIVALRHIQLSCPKIRCSFAAEFMDIMNVE